MNNPQVTIHETTAQTGSADVADNVTPSKALMADTMKPQIFIDPQGRRIVTRWLSTLDRMRVFRALGSDLSSNQAYLSYAIILASVSKIDDEMVVMPANAREFEALATRLGDETFDILQDRTVTLTQKIVEAREAAADAAKN